MDKERKLLKVAGILYGISGVLLLELPVLGILLILAGIYFFTQAGEDDDTLYKNRVIHYIIAIIAIVNIIASIIVFIANDNIIKYRKRVNGRNAPPKVVYKLDKESKKIDILIKLGVAMIFISGLLFATTSWSFINNYVKAIALIVFGLLFLGLSLFTEQKLKLYRSSYMYWLLSVSLFILTIVGVLYFGIFGSYLTYAGDGSHLAYAITFLSGAGFALTTYYKFPKKYLLYTCYAAVIIAFSNIILFINLSQMMTLSVISILILLTNIIDRKEGTINTFSTVVSYLLFGFIFIATRNTDLELLIACIINILNINYLSFIRQKSEESFLNIILTYILLIYGLASFTPLGDCIYIMITISITIYTLLINGNVIPTSKFSQRMNYIIYSITMVTLFLITISLEKFYVPSTYVFITLFHLAMNTMIKRGWFRIESWKLANYIQPLLIFNAVEAILGYYHDPLSLLLEIAVLAIIYSVMHFLYKNKLDRDILYIYLLITLVIGVFFKVNYEDIFGVLLVVLSCLYLFTSSYLAEENGESKIKVLLSYTLLLTSLYFPFVYQNILDINIFIPSLIFIVLIFIIAPILNNDWIKKISYLYIILPLNTLIISSELSYAVKVVLESATWLYIIFLINKFFIKNDLATCIISIIGIIYFCIHPFFIEDLIAGIYIGVLGLIVILIGYRKEGYFPLFITGIVMTVLNIVYRLKEVWKMIPFWLYLLIGGLTIIGFVTYRELKKQKQNELNKTKSN